MNNKGRYISLWLAVSEIMEKNYELAQEYSRKAEELTLTEPINAVGLRGQAIGLCYANMNITQVLKDRGLLNLD